MAKLLSTWLEVDDVVSPSFIGRVLVLEDDNQEPLSVDKFKLQPYRNQIAASVMSGQQSMEIARFKNLSPEVVSAVPSGPYFMRSGRLHRVFRVYEDSQQAFFSNIFQHQSGEDFSEVRPANQIHVPSRLYALPRTSKYPLAGLRFAVKDVFDLKGLKTSRGSRSYYDYCPPAEASARAVKDLIALGATLIGKTKNTQFANGEDPQEWIDYPCPWNPRGGLSMLQEAIDLLTLSDRGWVPEPGYKQ